MGRNCEAGRYVLSSFDTGDSVIDGAVSTEITRVPSFLSQESSRLLCDSSSFL